MTGVQAEAARLRVGDVLTGASAVLGDAVLVGQRESAEEIRSLVRRRWVGLRFRFLPRVEAGGGALLLLSCAASVAARAISLGRRGSQHSVV